MIKINVIVNDKIWIKFIKAPEKYLKNKLKKLNNNIFFKTKKIEFTILLTGNAEIKELNNRFRKKNKTTDVLSFPSEEKKKLSNFIRKKKLFYLGDVIININKIIKNLESKNFLFKFDKLWIHGLLHLLGSRHTAKNDYIKMEKLEKKFFNLVN
jgi:probable rRNA maturation factor